MSVQTSIKQLCDAMLDAQNGLATAKQNVIRFEAEVTKIRTGIDALKAIFPDEDFKAPAKAHAKAKPRKAGVKTDSDFWLGLITSEPQGTDDILAAAIKSLGLLDTDVEKIAVLKQRRPNFLEKLIADGKIKSEGARKDRRFSLV